MTAVGERLSVRVWVTEVWDVVSLAVTGDWTVARLKHAALARATGRTPDPARYEVKFRGAAVEDEAQTLTTLEVPDHGAVIVLPKQRQPVR